MPANADSVYRSVSVCVCVLMNHPYAKNIPLLRRIYKDRFSKVIFLIPFERLPDDDVITVYRGSYNHSGYLVDAASKIKEANCEYVLVTHDDVLINPKLSEETFLEYFPLEPNEGFIPIAGFNKDEYGSWCWYYGIAPKLLYPMSFVFGTGIEAATLRRYLPDPSELKRKFDSVGVVYTESLQLTERDQYDDISGLPSHLAILGRSGIASPERLDRISLDMKSALFKAIIEAENQVKGPSRNVPDEIDLPFPITFSKAFTDFYIVPAPSLADFIHFVGVGAAANLFVEVLTPIALFAACPKVRTARDFNLDFQFYGFTGRTLREMLNAHLVAVHPVKLSFLSEPADQAQFVADLDAIRDGSINVAPRALPGRQDLGNNLSLGFLTEGWHGKEPWGRWSCQKTSNIEFVYDRESHISALRVALHAKLHAPEMPIYRGTLKINGGKFQDLSTGPENSDVEIIIPAHAFQAGKVNIIEIISERVWTPRDFDPASLDGRSLGVGITALEFISESSSEKF